MRHHTPARAGWKPGTALAVRAAVYAWREAASLPTVAVTELLFCPFCREAHEGLTRCPEHDLPLVSALTLARQPRPTADDEPLPWFTPRLGRGWLGLGALLALWAFFAGSLASVGGEPHMSGDMQELASHSAPRLWLIPVASCMALALLVRRRTPRALRSARLAALLLALAPIIVVGWTLMGMDDALALLRARTRQTLALQLAPGAWVVALATCCMAVGALRLGVPPRRRLPQADREP